MRSTETLSTLMLAGLIAVVVLCCVQPIVVIILSQIAQR